MPGPLAKVDTQIGAINLDISRLLYSGSTVILEFIVPDPVSQWRILKTYRMGFDRIPGNEEDRRDGKAIKFDVADLDATILEVLRQPQLHLRWQGNIYPVNNTPAPAENEAQIFHITCSERTARNTTTAYSGRR